MAELTVNIEAFLQCDICLETLKDPRNLLCGHTFCKLCIEKWHLEKTNHRPSKSVAECPTCQKPFSLREDGATGLPINYHLSDMIEILKTKSNSSVLQMCEMCQSVPQNDAVCVCIDCKLNMCQDCKNSHDKFRGASSHIVTDMSETSEPLIAMRKKKSFCSQLTHEGHELEYYCKDCCIPVCTKCSVISHRDHRREELWMHARDTRFAIEQMTKDTKKKRDQYLKLLEDIKYEKDSLQFNKDEDIEKVRLFISELINVIRHKESTQIECISSVADFKIDQLCKKQTECETEIALIDSISFFADSLRKFGSDANIVLQGESVKSQSKNILQTAVNFHFGQNGERYLISERFQDFFSDLQQEEFVICVQSESCCSPIRTNSPTVENSAHFEIYMDAMSCTDTDNDISKLSWSDEKHNPASDIAYENPENLSMKTMNQSCIGPPLPPRNFKHKAIQNSSNNFNNKGKQVTKKLGKEHRREIHDQKLQSLLFREQDSRFSQNREIQKESKEGLNNSTHRKAFQPSNVLEKVRRSKENKATSDKFTLPNGKYVLEMLPFSLITKFDINKKADITGLTITQEHELIVVTNQPGSIAVFSQDGKRLCKLHGAFENPYDTAAGQPGIVYVTDTGPREYGIKVLQKIGRKYEVSTFLREPDNPHGISFYSGNIYVCDATDLSISVYRSKNKIKIRKIEAKVHGPIFSCPIYITALESDAVLISDYIDGNVYRICINQDHVSTEVILNQALTMSKGFRPGKTCTATDGKVLITDTVSREIYLTEKEFGKTCKINFSQYGVTPTVLDSKSQGSIWVGTKEGSVLHIMLVQEDEFTD